MKAVYKYKVPPNEFRLALSKGAQILHVAEQEDQEVRMWVLIDTEEELETRVFLPIATGQNLDTFAEKGKLEFIGTFFINADGLVFHLFEIKQV